MSHKTRKPSRMLPLLIVLIAAILGFVFLRDVLSFDALAENRDMLEALRDNNYAVTALVFILAYTLIVSFSLPGATIASLTGGFLFGIFPGAVFNVIAATIGATGIFLAAKSGLGDRLAALMTAQEGRMSKMKQELDRNQWSYLFVMRLVPAVPFFLANLLPALVGVPLHRFVVSTFFGIVPGAIVLTSVGAGLGSVLDQGEMPDLGIVFEPRILVPLLALGALSLLPIALRYFKKDNR